MIYLKTFKIASCNKSSNIYPYNTFKNKEHDIFIFDNITVLYGNNGSGKSTILNIIAHKLNLKGKERNSPDIIGTSNYFEEFIQDCRYELGEDEYNRKIKVIPEKSRYIKSEEILYEIRKIQQDSILEEGYVSNLVRNGISAKDAKDDLNSEHAQVQIERFKFAQEKYSNGETTLQILYDNIEPDCLYLLDEPEVSLSPQNQVELAKRINEIARYLGVQFIISTHSPFMLAILNAKIYNIDTKYYTVQKWSELENIKFFYNFFNEHKKEFEKNYKGK